MLTGTCPKCGAHLTVESSDEGIVTCAHCGTRIRININVNYNYSKSEHTEHIVDDAKIKAAENVDRVINIFASPIEERRRAKEEAKRKQEEAEEEAERRRKEAAERAQAEARIAEEQARIRRAENAKKRDERNAKIEAFCKAHPKETLISVVACCALLLGGIAIWTDSANAAREQAAHTAELARLEEEQIAYSHLAMGEVRMPAISMDEDARDVMKKLRDAGFTNVVDQPKHDLILGKNYSKYEIIEITVDGAPSFDTEQWYPLDTEIVVSYHDYIFG